MTRPRAAILGLALLLAAVPATADARRRERALRPHAFASCARLVAYERTHIAITGGVPVSSPRALAEPSPPVRSAAPQAIAPSGAGSPSGGSVSFSTTNNQEPGVEEPDIVKSDGATIFALERGTLYALSTRPTLRLAGSLSLAGHGFGAQLLLRGSRLLVISASSPVALSSPRAIRPNTAGTSPRMSAETRARASVPPFAPSPYYYPATTTVTEVDAHDPATMSVARVMTVEGTFVDARQNGPTARLVISSAPRAIATPALRSRPSGWLPSQSFHSFITGHRHSRPVAACSTVRRPAEFSGLGTLTILTIDLDRGLYAANGTALLADAEVVYGSQSSLYVATQRWINPLTPSAALPAEAETVIDRFDASKPDETPLVASGAVPGYLLNQFSMSEYRGYLRVASTSRPIWWGSQPLTSQSQVTVLANRGGGLLPVGRVSGLGAGQEIYSVRFIGDAGYVVTFRHVDPLYTIDLSSPTAPRVAGQLELEGYSAYLHPVGANLLLGIGEDVGPENRMSGTQIELFDVSNPAAPRLQARTTLGTGSYSQVQFNHHAFLFWPPSSLAVLPVQLYPPISPSAVMGAPASASPAAATQGATSPATAELHVPFIGAIAFRVDHAGIAEVGRISHDPAGGYVPAIERSLVIGTQLFTVSSEGVMASALSTLERQTFVAFPPGPATVGSGFARTASASG